jgi:hypothetical protein
MNVNPTMWLEDYQLTSDTLSLFFKDNNLHRASLNNHSFIVSQVDSGAFNQISGKNMEAFFANNELSNIEVKGNGESIYFVQDETEENLKGVNKIICSNMNIRLLNKAIESIHFYKEPDAKLYPIDEIQLKDFILKDFIWREKDITLEKLRLFKGFTTNIHFFSFSLPMKSKWHDSFLKRKNKSRNSLKCLFFS